MRNRYGLSTEAYVAMLESQQGRCAICGEVPTTNHKALCIDHDHATGQVRQLLCNPCNRALGSLKDDPERALAAYRYLMVHNSSKGARIA
jgi:hypothetical protein